MARLAGIPRATWGHLESGAGNPTLSVLHKVAVALQVPLEELTSRPAGDLAALPAGRRWPSTSRATASIRKLLPDPIPGVVIDRMEIPPGGRIPGVPHMPGTREYLTCESGRVPARGGRRAVAPVARATWWSSAATSGTRTATRASAPAVGYSVVLLAPGVS